MPFLLADNDVLLKAAHWKLLDFIPGCTGIGWGSTAVLESLKHRARRKDPKLFRSAGPADDLLACLNQTASLPPPDRSVIERLQGAVGLDAGEILLIATLCACDDGYLITGDKRSLRALAQKEFRDIAAKLRGRVISLEHLLTYCLQELGANQLAQQILPHRDMDSETRCIVPIPADATEIGIRQGLDSYLNELVIDSDGLVAKEFKPIDSN